MCGNKEGLRGVITFIILTFITEKYKMWTPPPQLFVYHVENYILTVQKWKLVFNKLVI
jgi:hypothetical protein